MVRIGRRVAGLMSEAVVAMLLALTVVAVSLPVVPVEAALR
jgi:hypothetical protein